KARPAASDPVGRRFEPGTAPYELLAGFSATIAYLESLGGMPVLAAYERTLAERGFGVWAHDNWFSLGLREKLDYPQEAVRVGLLHYNTFDEIERFNAELAKLSK